jgi:hypothetical protein
MTKNSLRKKKDAKLESVKTAGLYLSNLTIKTLNSGYSKTATMVNRK